MVIKKILKREKLTHKDQKALIGLLFVTPWLIGFLTIFLEPLINAFYYAFLEIKPLDDGSGMSKVFVGFDNFNEIFNVDPDFRQIFTESIIETITSSPVIVFFSLFAAILLNAKFKGRGIARTIFFLPLVFGLDIIGTVIESSAVNEVLKNSGDDASLGFLKATEIASFLVKAGIPKGTILFLTSSINEVFRIISFSAVQILLFLSGLQSINGSLYEVADIEGASRYEAFWKVTIPMISPVALLVTIYTIIDSFLRTEITTYIYDTAFTSGSFGQSSAMAILYFIVNVAIIGIVYFFMSKVVVYND